MNPTSTRQLWRSPICRQCRTLSNPRASFFRSFSSTPRWRADDDPDKSPPSARKPMASSTTTGTGRGIYDVLDFMRDSVPVQKRGSPNGLGTAMSDLMRNAPLTQLPPRNSSNAIINQTQDTTEPHHLNIYSTKHNTHLTLTRPSRAPILSVSAGEIGFRKSARGSFDAGYQLTAFLLKNITERNIIAKEKINKLELVFRGFGAGRDASTKAILGQEGKMIRHLITRVTDSTRLKFGGSRSPKPRRL
ncbi:MAG: hypothetical protein M1834_008087 [Cirrosporium novae-zelandiae]|nr:MAG: hypothetical protein M1834_008087 [Cirrosporium novae-zelandiae]